jgi:copper(I)-binding protein
MKSLIALALLMLAFLPASFAHDTAEHSHGLLIEKAWAPHTGKRTMSAAIYLTIKNESAEEDTLTGVSTEAANMSMLHESKMVDGVMIMEHIERLPIPAGGAVSLSPGALHLMLMQLAEPLKRGSATQITLHFEKAGDVPVIVEITGIGGPEENSGHGH